MYEVILKLIEEKGSMKVYDIAKELDISKEEVEHSIKFLENNLKIICDKRGNYSLPNNKNIIVGIIDINEQKGYGFVKTEIGDIFIPKENINGAKNNSTVMVQISDKEKGKNRTGKVIKKLNYNNNQIVGEIILSNAKKYIKFEDKKYRIEIEDENLVEGQFVLFNLISVNNKIKANIIKIIGHKNNPDIDMLKVINELGIEYEFSEESLAQTELISEQIDEKEISKRVDLRNKMIFTNDGGYSKDFDDAVSLEMKSNGNYLLGVHIADVTHYLKENSPLDRDAIKRGFSVYLIDKVIPMLPEKLSNGICSLNEGVDRLTLTCQMEIDNKGKLVNSNIFESIINSSKRMTYSKVNQVLDGKEVEGYEEYKDTLFKMNDLANIIRDKKIKRGLIDFDTTESVVITNDQGKAVDVILRERKAAEKLIEDFMIIANETVAKTAYQNGLIIPYRVHDIPDLEKLETVSKEIKSMGYDISSILKNNIYERPKVIQRILNELKEKPEYEVISQKLIRSMKKAEYSLNNYGHYCLASTNYTHFTSPIRRYSDDLVHRAIKNHLKNEKRMNLESLNAIITNVNKLEKKTAECERQVDYLKQAEYMESCIGNEYDAIISNVSSKGILVKLKNYIEGII